MDFFKEQKKTPSIFIIMGATGDLAKKKILPSLWHLFERDLLPEKLSVIGFSRDTLTDEEFQSFVMGAIKERGAQGAHEDTLRAFLNLFTYQAGEFQDARAFASLKSRIDAIENEWGVCTNKLFYLAVPPASFEPIFEGLASVNLHTPCGGRFGWSRILIEKPFGTDLASAEKLESLLSSYFQEEQIYRIDHYMFKEIVQGIENFRFSNNLFENAWDHTMIESIHIRLLESIGVEGRGSFYDPLGAFRDVGQNHILTMLASLVGEYPDMVGSAPARKSREDALRSLAPWTPESLKHHTYRAQYAGYRDIEGVAPDSQTETYFALRTELATNRFRGVPILMEAGKRMGEARKEIILTLKHPKKCLLCKESRHKPNRIVFRLEPNDEIVIHFWTKKPGFERELEEREFSFFLYERQTKVQYVEEYAKVLYGAIVGDQSLFLSREEVLAAWAFTDPVERAWRENLVPLETYEPDTAPEPPLLRSADSSCCQEKQSLPREIGIVGLGKMGSRLALRLLSKGWAVSGYNTSSEGMDGLREAGLRRADSLEDLVGAQKSPRLFWLMVPHQAVDDVLEKLTPHLEKGDTVIDGGNSPYRESMRRAEELAKRGIRFLDAGVSGGPEGALGGSCIMVGGERDAYKAYEHLFRDLATGDGYAYMGRSGAGHFVKMVHNGIEYGMMQAIGEGFEIMKRSPFDLNLPETASLYNRGSVIESRLVGWLARAYEKYGENLDGEECCSGSVSMSGEGQWTVDTAKELGVPVEIIKGALEFRKRSQKHPSYTGQVISALRHEFGGHDTTRKEN